MTGHKVGPALPRIGRGSIEFLDTTGFQPSERGMVRVYGRSKEKAARRSRAAFVERTSRDRARLLVARGTFGASRSSVSIQLQASCPRCPDRPPTRTASRAVVPRMRMPGRRVGMRPPFADQASRVLGMLSVRT